MLNEESTYCILSHCTYEHDLHDKYNLKITSIHSLRDETLLSLIKLIIISLLVSKHVDKDIALRVNEELNNFIADPIKYVETSNSGQLKSTFPVPCNWWCEALFNYFLLKYYAEVINL